MAVPRALAAAATGAALVLASGGALERGAKPFPSLAELPGTPFTLQDAAVASVGSRAVAADLAWIQLLQYAAEGLPELPSPPDRPMADLKTMALRVVRLDPAFHRAYLYGASLLGWFGEVNRPREAGELLREGLRRDPGQPLYSLYLAALAYQKKGDVEKMVALLETMVDDPRAPSMLKPILANLYKQRGEYGKALRLWEQVADDEDSSERRRALAKIAELKRLLRK